MPPKMRGHPMDQTVTRSGSPYVSVRLALRRHDHRRRRHRAQRQRRAIPCRIKYEPARWRGDDGSGSRLLSAQVLPLSIIWALVAIGVEAPNSPAGAKYTRAAVKYTALILAAKLAALAAFALKVGPEL